MKAIELRLGNLVVYPKYYHNGEGRFFRVRTIYSDSEMIGLTDDLIQTTVKISNIKPVELTEEWLIKCGFEKWQYGEHCFTIKYSYDNNFVLFSTNNHTAQVNKFPPDQYYYGFNRCFNLIQHLHQLQNLYFALTGEELQITK